MATATTSAVPPLASSVMWAKCSKVAALSGVTIFEEQNTLYYAFCFYSVYAFLR